MGKYGPLKNQSECTELPQNYLAIKWINNGLYLARKYARIFVHGHYLFQDANSFPKVKLEENWPWGTDNVRGKKYKHIFAQNWCRVSYPSNVLQHAWTWNIVYEKLTVWSVRCLFCVLWYKLYEQKISPFFCKNHKTFSHLELNFKRRLIVEDVRFENWSSRKTVTLRNR